MRRAALFILLLGVCSQPAVSGPLAAPPERIVASGITGALVICGGGKLPEEAARRFMTSIDSAVVMHNASTQFSDGGEFGMGAEIGIATGKMHARGPVGLEQLTSFKYLVHGNGQTRP